VVVALLVINYDQVYLDVTIGCISLYINLLALIRQNITHLNDIQNATIPRYHSCYTYSKEYQPPN
jgi:hypothetical protein